MRRGITAAILFGVVVAVFSAVTTNELVRYDDYDYIVRNEAIGEGLSPRTVGWAFTAAGYASNYHPLTWISHAADVTLAKAVGIAHRQSKRGAEHLCRENGAFAWLIHAENVLWHAANAVLLWLVMLTLLRTFNPNHKPETSNSKHSNIQTFKLQTFKHSNSKHSNIQTLDHILAAFFALLWAVHPLRVEVVAWASERKELLSTAFMLLTLLTHVRGDSGSRGARVLAIFFFILALLSKPMAVSLPVVIFAYEWALRGRGFRETLRRLWPYVGLSAFFCYMTMISQGDGLMGGQQFTPVQKLLSVVEAPIVYAWQTVWPVGLTIDYAFPDWSSWPLFAAGIVLLAAMAVVVVAYAWRRAAFGCLASLGCSRGSAPTTTPNNRQPILSLLIFAIAWVYVGLIPVLGVVKVGYEPHSDRYTYWIGCGVAVLCARAAVWAYGRWGAALRPHQGKIAYAGGAVLLVLGVMSFRQCRIWKNSETLFASVVRATGNEHFAHALDERIMFVDPGRVKEAEKILREVLQRKRTSEARAALAYHLAVFADAHKPIVFAGIEKSAFDEARLFAQYALEETSGGHDWACAALAFADYREEKYDSAVAWMRKALDLGFESGFVKVDLDEWKKKAAEKRVKDVQGK